MKKIISLILTLIMLFGVMAFTSGCGYKPHSSGYFIYQRNDNKEYADRDKVYISGLTEEGKQQKILIIPEYIDGYKVVGLNDHSHYPTHITTFDSDILEKVYVVADIVDINTPFFAYCSNLKKVLIIKQCDALCNMPMDNNKYTGNIYYNLINDINYNKLYYPQFKSSYEDYKNYICDLWETDRQPANVGFYMNISKDSTNEGYWTDDLDNEFITLIPPDPVREGYTFDGWCKESECINKWDFETDKVPAKDYITESTYNYHETCLYAKWIKN